MLAEESAGFMTNYPQEMISSRIIECILHVQIDDDAVSKDKRGSDEFTDTVCRTEMNRS